MLLVSRRAEAGLERRGFSNGELRAYGLVRPRPRPLACLVVALLMVASGSVRTEPVRGITAAPAIAAAYDLVLDADVDGLPATLAQTCGPAPVVACLGLESLSLWWQIQLDPDSRALDAAFAAAADRAIAASDAWTSREPERAEAWFYLGAALGVRAQWKVLRTERRSAARDGKRIKEALERALALDPAMHDAEFGLGMYRYYAGVAPAIFRWLRFLLLMPGGNREDGLRQLLTASREGQLVGGEADYQIHLLYLWYEQRAPEALQLVRSLQTRYPRNPLFHQIEAEILDVYMHDTDGSLHASEALLALAQAGKVHRADIAEVRARLNIALQASRLGQRDRALMELNALIARAPAAPADAMKRAIRLRDELTP